MYYILDTMRCLGSTNIEQPHFMALWCSVHISALSDCSYTLVPTAFPSMCCIVPVTLPFWSPEVGPISLAHEILPCQHLFVVVLSLQQVSAWTHGVSVTSFEIQLEESTVPPLFISAHLQTILGSHSMNYTWVQLSQGMMPPRFTAQWKQAQLRHCQPGGLATRMQETETQGSFEC